MLELSCADFTFPLLQRRQALQLIRLLGIEYVDVGLFARSSTFSPRDLCAAPAAFTRQMETDFDDTGVNISDLFLQVGDHPQENAVNDPDANVRAHARDVFLRSLELCTDLQCKHMTGLPGVPQNGEDSSQDFELAAQETAWRLEQCIAAGVRYSIEPHIGSICDKVDKVFDFLNAVNGLSVTLDYGHFIYKGQSPNEVHPLLKHASHIHLRGGAKGKLQTSVSENAIDFAGIVSRLATLGYDGFLALEYVWVDWEGCNRTDNLSETILLHREISAMLRSTKKVGADV
jgi:sugar phosphate isomerase/epimerase